MRPLAASLSVLVAALCGFAASAIETPNSPQQELTTFHFADTNLTADLIAAEPDVASPVCVAWDADGRMYVAEMTDYPMGATGGRVRLLDDRDGDGRFERVTVFADQLPFPTSVLPWSGGVLVAAAPDIWFLKDNDGDGQADERHVLFTGFGQGNQQLRVNGLTWGIDNWVYGANGRSDGEVRAVEVQVGSDWARIGPALARTNSLRGRDFRFRPVTGEFETIAGRSQFGTTFDDWGNRFLSWNTMPFRHVVIETRYLDRVPQLGAAEPAQDLQPSGDDGRVFPLTAPPQVFNNESQTHFNASAGTTIYRGDALGKQYKGNIFVGETLRNLVQRRVLVPKGATFEAPRAAEGEEFLASTDPWFHPVNFATGPDGALYVVDFYRQFVEHPGYVPEEMRNKVDWRIGAEHGRIWRIRPKNWKPTGPRPNLSHANSSELVKHLNNANAWWRDTAQRLLVERQDKAALGALEKLARKSSSAVGRLHALYTLTGLDALKPELVVTTLRDSDPRVRAHGIRLSEQFLAGEGRVSSSRDEVESNRRADRGGLNATSLPASEVDRRRGGIDRISPNQVDELREALIGLATDNDAQVRLQLTLALGDVEDEKALSGLVRLTEPGIRDRWQSLAILASAGRRPWPFWKSLNAEGHQWLSETNEAIVQFIDKLGALVGASANAADWQEAIAWLRVANRPFFMRMALFDALAENAKKNDDLRQALTEPGFTAGVEKRSFEDLRAEAKAAAAAADTPVPVRTIAIRLLGKSDPDLGRKALPDLLKSTHPMEVQAAAVTALAQLNDGAAAAAAFAAWSDYSRSTRQQLLGSALRSSAIAAALLDALDQGMVAPIEVDPASRQGLLKLQSPALRERAEVLFKNQVPTDRDEVVRQFQPCLQLEGDRRRGALIFARMCLTCHAMQGRGSAVGPNIYSVASQPKETLLANILDPSRQVTPDYVSYTLTTTDGEMLSGLIAGESSAGVTLRRQNLPDLTVQRRRIKEIKAEGKSLMPDGLEQGLTQQDLADLLEFIRQPDATMLPQDK